LAQPFLKVDKIDYKNNIKDNSIIIITTTFKMDLKQRKLNRSEWNSIEIPVSKSEIDILNLIIQGYSNVNIKMNNNNSIFTFLKIEYSEKMEDHLYIKYLKERCDKIETDFIKFKKDYKKIKIDSNSKINSADKIRLDRYNCETLKKQDIYEFLLVTHMEELLYYKSGKKDKQFNYHYYSLYKLIRNNITRLNRHIIGLVNNVLTYFEDAVDKSIIIENAVEFIEKNTILLKYYDLTLYQHQKDIFTSCKKPNPKLILYMAPTGTGKTITPIALSEQNRIIFVCAARHVGVALARAAISVNKKIAFAFGCASADDIRLHYFAAKEFTRRKRGGAIKKVDNSVGDNVEIIICDIKSYLPAMYYMLAFNKAENLICYWDEPTITLDYESHDFHKTIRNNWKNNIIPNVVLSSATLPKLHELTETIPDFLNKFAGAEICNITSHDCKKSIPIINKDGFVVLPHYLYENYEDILKVATHCEGYLTLLRYFDLKEVAEFITYVIKNNFAQSRMRLDRHFETLDSINMTNIKIYYVELLKNILRGTWGAVYLYFKHTRKQRISNNETIDTKGNKITKSRSVGPGITTTTSSSNSLAGTPLSRLASEQITTTTPHVTLTAETKGTTGVYVTTKDAYTLTDGPTIFITNEIEKIAKFCIQQANIPASIMDEIMKKIDYNNMLNERIDTLEREVEYIKEKADKFAKNNVSDTDKSRGITVNGRNKSCKDTKKLNRDNGDQFEGKGEMSKLTAEVNALRSMIKATALNDTFVPNKKAHLDKWAEGIDNRGAFTSNIDEHIVSDIMALKGVENSWKVLLLMGIGVFINHDNIAYTEIMKRLADEQKLYMIIASSDYIYGTNYQFCHGYLSKDLDLTQEKIIQAMGRIGRNNIQQTYTLRFRDDGHIMKLFTSETEKPEIINMNRLFNSKKVVWQNNSYVEVEDNEDEVEIIIEDDVDLEDIEESEDEEDEDD
jgi:hypothetical protein